MTLRSLALLAALALSTPALADVGTGAEQARALINQGQAHEVAGKINEALESYRAAAKADPGASQALSCLALLMVHASQNTEAQYVEPYRKQATAYANAALKIDKRDPNAMEALRRLADGVERQRREPAPAAYKVALEGEALFADGKYAEAALKYEQAIRLDPGYTDAVVFLGDCYYLQGDMVRAEQQFRQAALMEPLLGPAWRYLYDTLRKQGKYKEAEAAAFGAIASMPSSKPNWLRVAESLDLAGRPIKPFQWQPRAWVKGAEIQIDPTGPESDSAAWTAHALSLAAAEGKQQTPFARQVAVWTDTLQIISEMGNGDKIKDEGLRDMIRFHKGGQLKAAIFALHYKEAYRAEFEAWKKAEPEGLTRFVETFRVGIF
jgi:tetratricopeptide (TPR) repeat protein